MFFVGCIYAANAGSYQDLTIGETMAMELVGLPVCLEHGTRSVGRIVHSHVDPVTGFCTVTGALNSDAAGRVAVQLIREGVLRELSLCHLIMPDGHKRAKEVSLVRKGARSGTCIYLLTRSTGYKRVAGSQVQEMAEEQNEFELLLDNAVPDVNQRTRLYQLIAERLKTASESSSEVAMLRKELETRMKASQKDTEVTVAALLDVFRQFAPTHQPDAGSVTALTEAMNSTPEVYAALSPIVVAASAIQRASQRSSEELEAKLRLHESLNQAKQDLRNLSGVRSELRDSHTSKQALNSADKCESVLDQFRIGAYDSSVCPRLTAHNSKRAKTVAADDVSTVV